MYGPQGEPIHFQPKILKSNVKMMVKKPLFNKKWGNHDFEIMLSKVLNISMSKNCIIFRWGRWGN
jgi:hypothetical protein